MSLPKILGLPRDLVQRLLPHAYGPQEYAIITLLLVDCEAHVGQVRFDTREQSNSRCWVCFDAMTSTLTLSHDRNTSGSAAVPCGRSYHLACLVEWCRTNVANGHLVTCPGDRIELFSRKAIPANSLLQDITSDHDSESYTRHINNVMPFWRNIQSGDHGSISSTYEISFISPDQIIRLARLGCDVGFVDWDTVAKFPMSELSRRIHRRFGAVKSQDASHYIFDPVPADTTYRMYQVWLYIQLHRRLVDHDTGEEHADYVFVPLSPFRAHAMRRELWSTLGSGYVIQTLGRTVVASIDHLAEDVHREAIHESCRLGAATQSRGRVHRPASPSLLGTRNFNPASRTSYITRGNLNAGLRVLSPTKRAASRRSLAMMTVVRPNKNASRRRRGREDRRRGMQHRQH